MMTTLQKIGLCFLLSAFLFSVVIVLFITGVFHFQGDIAHNPAEIIVLTAVFCTLFLVVFFCLNVRQDAAAETRVLVYEEREEREEQEEWEVLDELAVVDDAPDETADLEDISTVSGVSVSIFRQPFSFSSGNPEFLQEVGVSMIYERNGVHYVNTGSDVDQNRDEELDGNFAKLVESVVNRTLGNR